MDFLRPHLPARHWMLLAFLSSALFIHYRGRDRFELKRALDFTVLLAPLNALLLLFSRVPRAAFIDARRFPERVGGLSRAFQHVYRLRLKAKALKARNRGVYYAGKCLLILGLVWAVFW